MTSFVEATKVTPIDSHTYSAHLPQEWCIGSVPHGGYVTSVILSAASLHFSTTLSSQNQPHPLTLHLTFLRRTSIGPATIHITDTKLGLRTSTIHITLLQGPSRVEVAGYVTYSNLLLEQGLNLLTSWSLTPPPYPADISLLKKDADPNWKLQSQMPFAAFRKASAKVHFYLPSAGQLDKSITDEWLRFSNGEKFTMGSLGYVADMFPQVVEAYRDDPSVNRRDSKGRGEWPNFWYPTLLLNLEVKKVLPPEGVEWLFVRVRAKQIRNGRMDLEVVVLDEVGELVALSQHVSLILGAERNLAGRKGEAKM